MTRHASRRRAGHPIPALLALTSLALLLACLVFPWLVGLRTFGALLSPHWVP